MAFPECATFLQQMERNVPILDLISDVANEVVKSLQMQYYLLTQLFVSSNTKKNMCNVKRVRELNHFPAFLHAKNQSKVLKQIPKRK